MLFAHLPFWIPDVHIRWEILDPFYGMKTSYRALYVELKLGYALHALFYSMGLKLSFTFPQKLVIS